MTSIVPVAFPSPLAGTEMLRAFGVGSNGQPSGEDFLLTTAQIASLASANPNPAIAVGASATAVIGKTYLFNRAAGSTLTLPAAAGTGGVIKVFVTVTTTSAADKVLANSTADYMIGNIIGQTGGTPAQFSATAATDHALQMPFAGSQPSGGFVGDWFELQDIAANLWSVKGMFQAGTTPTSPFSATNT